MSTTIVSCYYRLVKSKHNIKLYSEWINNFFMIATNKIIFTNKDTYENEFIKYKDRKDVVFILKEFNEFKTWKYKNVFLQNLEVDPEKNKHNIYLYLIWNEKSEFINQSIKLNFFKTDYFLYCDIGSFRVKNLMKYYIHWPNPNVVNKIKKVTLLLIESFEKKEFLIKKNGLPDSFLNKNRIGGGIILSPKNNFKDWYEKYYYILEKFIDNNRFIGKDQLIMSTIVVMYPKLFNIVCRKDSIYCLNGWFYLQPYLNGIFK